MSACKHRVSGSLSLPSRGSFHLSLTVLYSIGHQVVFSLRRWSSCLPTGFLVSCGTPDTPRFSYISPTRLLLSLVRLSSRVRLCIGIRYGVHYPFAYRYARFGLFPFRSPLLRKSIVFFLFLRVLRCFSSPGSLP